MALGLEHEPAVDQFERGSPGDGAAHPVEMAGGDAEQPGIVRHRPVGGEVLIHQLLEGLHQRHRTAIPHIETILSVALFARFHAAQRCEHEGEPGGKNLVAADLVARQLGDDRLRAIEQRRRLAGVAGEGDDARVLEMHQKAGRRVEDRRKVAVEQGHHRAGHVGREVEPVRDQRRHRHRSWRLQRDVLAIEMQDGMARTQEQELEQQRMAVRFDGVIVQPAALLDRLGVHPIDQHAVAGFAVERPGPDGASRRCFKLRVHAWKVQPIARSVHWLQPSPCPTCG